MLFRTKKRKIKQKKKVTKPKKIIKPKKKSEVHFTKKQINLINKKLQENK